MYSFELCIVPRYSAAAHYVLIGLRAKSVDAALKIVFLVAYSGILQLRRSTWPLQVGFGFEVVELWLGAHAHLPCTDAFSLT